jgi:hypothetical protein
MAELPASVFDGLVLSPAPVVSPLEEPSPLPNPLPPVGCEPLPTWVDWAGIVTEEPAGLVSVWPGAAVGAPKPDR